MTDGLFLHRISQRTKIREDLIMALSAELQRLIDVSAPLWAGEAEVVRTY
jgi:hypothetical protein